MSLTPYVTVVAAVVVVVSCARLLWVQRLARKEARDLNDFFDSAAIGLHWVGADGTVLRVNRAELEMLGYSEDEYVGHPITEFHVDRPVIDDILCRLTADETLHDYPARLRARDGSVRDVLITSSVYRVNGAFRHTRCFTRDVTAQRRAEEAARALQRLDSVGRLAGGIAHEVNNQMNVVLGATHFILQHPDIPAEVRDDVGHIVSAANRSARITGQLLAFSRRQMLQPEVCDPREIVRSFESVLRRSLAPSSGLRVDAGRQVGNVKVDCGQIEQVLLNLVLNAADAMPDGGLVTIAVRETSLGTRGEAGVREPVTQPGRYVVVAVTDTGLGMDPETEARLFEPFFTTKEVGKGTGLGLSTVYGIIRQSGGYVGVTTAPGQGSTFSVYLPVTTEPMRAAPPAEAEAAPHQGSVLVVEDEPEVRRMAARVLRSEGYKVSEAADAREALAALGTSGPFDLLLSDVSMPVVSGLELADRVRRDEPDLPILLMTGHTGSDDIRRAAAHGGYQVLDKPYTPDVLLSAVAMALSGPPVQVPNASRTFP
jgi:PAS domain S-box-containing protein